MTPEEALEKFRRSTTKEGPPCRIYVSRLKKEVASDILLFYKGRKTDLTAKPLVRYEGESGIGSGPLREFFSLSMQLLEDGIQGIHSSGNKILIFEGQDDHKLPIKDPLLRQTGLFVAAGKMLAHSALHGGPGVHGLSPAIIHYWTHEDSVSTEEMNVAAAPLHLDDIPDITLRDSLQQVIIVNNKIQCL